MVQLKRVDGTHAKTQEEMELTLKDLFVNLLEEPDHNKYEAQTKVLLILAHDLGTRNQNHQRIINKYS